MIACVECGGAISSSAGECVHCGRVFRPPQSLEIPGVGTIAMGVFLGTIGASVVLGIVWVILWIVFLGSLASSLSRP